jgi:ankyrin repeat protein/adenylate kinase family enzyme
MLDRRDNIEPCHTNTCQWILELDEYRSWRNQPCGLLWVKGKPGAGKSTLMVFLHDRLKESQDAIHGVIRLDFFFTARGTEMQRTPLGMLRSLLNQIFDRDATIRPHVREIYEQRCRQFGYGERKWEWPQTILEDLLASAILASANDQHVIIFVDALDEAGAESAQKLAAYFHRLVDRADNKKLTLQVCISCRHYPILESARARAIHVEDHNQDDIATYIKDMLLETEFGDVPSQEMREVLVEELTQHAKGVFQWAHLIIPLVKQKFIEGESISDIRDWLGDVPADLENVYVYILSNVITARNRDQSFLFFQWVCLAERPLTIVEIRYALAAKNAQITPSRIEWEKLHGFVESNERMKRRVKALAGGLAEVVSSGNDEETVQVVHQSVNDFLRAKGLALLYHGISASMGSMDMDNILFQSQATLYRSCLLYLATICSNKQMSNFRRSKENLVCDHPFLNYATINLFIHAEKAAGSRGALLHNEKDILQRMISYWVEIYQHLGTYHTACPPKGTRILHMAAAANLVDVITSALSGNEDIERKNKVGDTALHFAARAGHTTTGKILQERGANREAKNNDGATPLIEAAGYGHLGFVGWLLEEGVEIETGGGAALQKASVEGHNAIIEILLGVGANVNAQGGEYGNALQAAAWNGSAETVKILLDAQANVNAQGGEYGNALQAAASRGSAEKVRILLDAQANVNAQGGHFGNALQAAAYDGSAETVKILLNA